MRFSDKGDTSATTAVEAGAYPVSSSGLSTVPGVARGPHRMWPRMAMNAVQHEIANLLKTSLSFIIKFYTKVYYLDITFTILVITNWGLAQ